MRCYGACASPWGKSAMKPWGHAVAMGQIRHETMRACCRHGANPP